MPTTSFVTGVPNLLLRAEALIMFLGAVAAYFWLGGNWLLFLMLALLPDLAMLGYLAGLRVGTAVYNSVHWYGVPLITLAIATFGHFPIVADVALVWIAHISFDRMIGAGLKYADGFRFSHLGVYGREAKETGSTALPG